MEQKYLQAFVNETRSSNELVLGCFFPAAVWEPLPHFLQSWLRNFTAGSLIYLVAGLFWCFYIYSYSYNIYIHKDAIPSRKSMLLQIYVAMKAMPWYSGLSAVSEYLIENGWTKCFASVNDIGWPAYICYLAAYLVFVEFGVYWMHKLLHDIKPLYKHLHATHHIFNKQNTLSPFAGMAFHPLDGVLLALPHVIGLFLVPIHFTAYRTLLLVEAIWSTNIHDNIHGKLWPIMGAGYHTIHHTTYRHNYGHYTVWVDWMFGTLQDPQDDNVKTK